MACSVNEDWQKIVSQVCQENEDYRALLQDSDALQLDDGDIYIYAPSFVLPEDEDSDEYYEMTEPIKDKWRNLYNQEAYFYDMTLDEERKRLEKETVEDCLKRLLTEGHKHDSEDFPTIAFHMTPFLFAFASLIANTEAQYIRGHRLPTEDEVTDLMHRQPKHEPTVDDIITFGNTDETIIDAFILHTQITDFLEWYLKQPAYDMDIDLPLFTAWNELPYMAKKWNEYIEAR